MKYVKWIGNVHGEDGVSAIKFGDKVVVRDTPVDLNEDEIALLERAGRILVPSSQAEKALFEAETKKEKRIPVGRDVIGTAPTFEDSFSKPEWEK